MADQSEGEDMRDTERRIFHAEHALTAGAGEQIGDQSRRAHQQRAGGKPHEQARSQHRIKRLEEEGRAAEHGRRKRCSDNDGAAIDPIA